MIRKTSNGLYPLLLGVLVGFIGCLVWMGSNPNSNAKNVQIRQKQESSTPLPRSSNSNFPNGIEFRQ